MPQKIKQLMGGTIKGKSLVEGKSGSRRNWPDT